MPPGEGGLEPQLYRARAGTRSWETLTLNAYIYTQMMHGEEEDVVPRILWNMTT